MDQTHIARTDMENRWSLTSADHALVVAKSQDNRLSFAALLLFFRNHGHIGARAERKVDRELLDDIKPVTGKQNLLFEVADATL